MAGTGSSIQARLQSGNESESESERECSALSQSYVQECEVKLSSVEVHRHEVSVPIRDVYRLRREVRVLACTSSEQNPSLKQ